MTSKPKSSSSSSGSSVLATVGGKEELQSALESYTNQMSLFHFDAARDEIEAYRSRDLAGTVVDDRTTSWLPLLAVLGPLTQAEKSYHQLAFLFSKGFLSLRKDSQLKTNYNALRSELSSQRRRAPSSAGSESLAEHLTGQLHLYITARMDMMNAYEGIATLGAPKSLLGLGTVLEILAEIEDRNQGAFNHPAIAALATVFSYELEILMNLLRAEVEMSRLAFLPSLLHLKEAHSRLKTWLGSAALTATVQRPASFLSALRGHAKPIPQLGLCLWLQNLYNHLISKFSLLFLSVLAPQGGGLGELKTILASAPVNVSSRIAAFHRKADLAISAVIADTAAIPDFPGLLGYRHPEAEAEGLRGLDSFPALFALATPERPGIAPHMPAVVMQLGGAASLPQGALSASVEAGGAQTWVLARLSAALWLVLLCPGRRSAQDPQLVVFARDLAAQLSADTLFAQLKTPAKTA